MSHTPGVPYPTSLIPEGGYHVRAQLLLKDSPSAYASHILGGHLLGYPGRFAAKRSSNFRGRTINLLQTHKENIVNRRIMEILACFLFIGGCLTITACDSSKELNTEEPAQENPPLGKDSGDEPRDEPRDEPQDEGDIFIFEFSAADYTVPESAESATVSIRREGSLAGPATIAYSATGLTAMPDQNFVPTEGSLEWQDGEGGTKSFTVDILEDELTLEDVTIHLELFSATENTLLGELNTATLTIKKADQVGCVDLENTRISTDTTLPGRCYNVLTDIVVSNAATLTIEPGATLKFAAGRGLEVEDDGLLYAEGTEDEYILFTAALPTTGYWNGIDIRSVASSVIKHAIVEYGGGGGFNPANIGLAFNGRAQIEDSIIRYSGSYGISLDDGEILTSFNNNILTLNESAPVRIHANGLDALDNDSQFTGNEDAAGQTFDYIHVVGNDVTRDQTWQSLEVDYRFASSSIKVNAVLNIEPGAKLVFPANGQLNIERDGTLKALGTEEQPITFTGRSQSPGFWRGIQFTFSNNANELDHVIVEYGGASSNSDANVGVFGQNGRLSISNSILQHSETYGFYFHENTALTMNNIRSTANAIPGSAHVNDIGKLDAASDYTGNDTDWVSIAGNTLSRDQTIKNIGVPYRISRTATVAIESVVNIEPGVELQFSTSGGLNIRATGSLIATGTPEQPVVFTGTEKLKGHWRGIHFIQSASQANLIDHAIIEYAGAEGGNTQGLVSFWSGNVHGTVSNSVLRSSLTHGIWVDSNATGSFSDGNTFEDIEGEDIYTP